MYPWILSVLFLAGACSHGGGGLAGQDRNFIPETEILDWRDTGVTTVHELIEKARPRWFTRGRVQSVHTPTTVLVYLGGSLLGDRDQLRGMPIDMVQEIRWLDAAEAGMLPGGGASHVEGAIVLTVRDGGT